VAALSSRPRSEPQSFKAIPISIIRTAVYLAEEFIKIAKRDDAIKARLSLDNLVCLSDEFTIPWRIAHTNGQG